jgi:hypothetical protein
MPPVDAPTEGWNWETGWEDSRFEEEVPSHRYAARDEGGDDQSRGQEKEAPMETWDSAIGKETQQVGTEALAWYLPYHSSVLDYGIYFRETGLLFLADLLESGGVSALQSLGHSYQFLNGHEEIHFGVEAVSSFAEYFSNRSFYPNRFGKPLGYGKSLLTPAQVEEALATAFAVSRERAPSAESLLEDFATHHQPAGYRDWREVKWRARFSQGLDDYFNHIGSFAGFRSGPWSPLFSWSRDRTGDVPRYIIRDAAPGRGIVFGFRYDGVELEIHFAKEHPPPHFHVRIPPRVGANLRFEYPGLNPVGPGGRSLKGWERRAVEQAIERYPREIFQQEFDRHKDIVLRGKEL